MLDLSLSVSPTLRPFFLANSSWTMATFLSSGLMWRPSTSLKVSALKRSSKDESLVPVSMAALPKRRWRSASIRGRPSWETSSLSTKSATIPIRLTTWLMPSRPWMAAMSLPRKFPLPRLVPWLLRRSISIEKEELMPLKVSLEATSVARLTAKLLKETVDMTKRIRKIIRVLNFLRQT